MESQNVWYLDTKPDNIVIDHLGNVYIVDHGKSTFDKEDD